MTPWLKFQKNVAKAFPAVSTYLNGQAHESAIAALEQRFGHALPQAFRDIYEEHDGEAASSTGNVFGLRFLPIQSIVEELDAWREIVRGGLEDLNDDCTSKPKGAIQCVYANEKWLPLFSDGGGNYIGLDFDPGPKGTVGQVINFGRDEEGKHVLAKDLDKFLVQLAQLVGWPVIEGNAHGGFSVNGMHFIDAIKNIKNLPSKNPDHGDHAVTCGSL